MSIKSNIEEIVARLAEEEENDITTTADDMREKVVRAIIGGASQWDGYMRLFARDEKELARLRPEAPGDDASARNLARAYLIGNGPCTVLTRQNLLFGVTDALDYETEEQERPLGRPAA